MTDRTDAAAWNFDGFGPAFDEHVAAHLPGYMDVQRLVALFAQFTLPTGGLVVDIGGSTGKTVDVIAEALPGRAFDAVIYDPDDSMLDVARERLAARPSVCPEFVAASLPGGWAHTEADLTLALWTLQFIPQAAWLSVLSGARTRSKPTGALLVAAKTEHEDVRWQEIAVAALDDYKAEAGVSAEERAAKTRALRGAMYTAPASKYLEKIARAGWHSPTILWRWHVWTVIVAHAAP